MKKVNFFKSLILKLTVIVGILLLPFSFLPAVWAADEKDAQTVAPQSASEPSTIPVTRPNPFQTIYDKDTAKIEAVADSLEYQKDSRKLIARGNAVVTYQDMKLLADYAEVESDTKKAYAKGHVIIFKNDKPTVQGNELFYDFGKHTGSFPDSRSISAPFYAHGETAQQIREGVTKIQNAGVTTCNLEKPHYEFRCRKATLYSNEKLNMYSVTLYVLGKPVFWWPFMTVPLNWPNIPFQASAGYNTRFGAYIELTKGVTINKYLWGMAHFDWRAKRGVGGGWDQYYDFGKYAHGNVKLYLTQDKKAPTPGNFYDKQDSDFDPYATTQDRTRGRISWRHRTDINDNTNVILRYNRLADEYFLQEFFEKEYRSEVEQHSFVTGTHNTERYGAMIHVEKKMNDFESLVERLPEVRLDWKNQPFFTDKVYNESRVQFDNLYKRYCRLSQYQSTMRTDAYTNWYTPLKWNEFKLTPYMGVRGTQYSKQATTDSACFRALFEYGADLRTQFYRLHDVSFDKFGIEVNQLRHIFEPVVTFDGTVSSKNNNRFTRFDTIDALDDSAQLGLGMENRLQTKRVVGGKPKRVDIVSLNTYIFFNVKSMDPTVRQQSFTLFENELTLRPYEWLQSQTRVEYDFSTSYFKRINQDFLAQHKKWKFLFGYRYVHNYFDWYDQQTIDTSQQFVFDVRYVINHLWEVGGYTRWDTKTGNLDEWQVSATRDLHDFIFDFGYNVRNSLINDYNNQLFFNFRLKAFPGYALSGGGGRADFSEPRIGETVAGANQGAGKFQTATDSQFLPLRQ